MNVGNSTYFNISLALPNHSGLWRENNIHLRFSLSAVGSSLELSSENNALSLFLQRDERTCHFVPPAEQKPESDLFHIKSTFSIERKGNTSKVSLYSKHRRVIHLLYLAVNLSLSVTSCFFSQTNHYGRTIRMHKKDFPGNTCNWTHLVAKI